MSEDKDQGAHGNETGDKNPENVESNEVAARQSRSNERSER